MVKFFKRTPIRITSLLFVGFLTMALHGHVYGQDRNQQAMLQACNESAAQLNRNNPMRIDAITTLNSIVCVFRRGTVEMVYNMRVNSGGSANLAAEIVAERPSQINSWCSHPDSRRLVNYHPIVYEYFDVTGKYIVSNRVSRTDC
jgi:hypothetical protein